MMHSRAQREAFLIEVAKATGGNPDKTASIYDVARAAKLPDADAEAVAAYLRKKELIDYELPASLRITGDGFDEAEHLMHKNWKHGFSHPAAMVLYGFLLGQFSSIVTKLIERWLFPH